jgi:transcriptional regulator with XRE-family HTH domain
MVTYESGEQVGELLRQLRRQRNLTQTELGGTEYSKSYISAVEKNKIRPTSQALEYFAKQLDQPPDYFITWSEHLERRQHSGLSEMKLIGSQPMLWSGQLTMIDLLLERVDHLHFPADAELPLLTSEQLDAMPPPTQARYFLLKGLEAQARQEYSTALDALEHALPFAPARLQPIVLDALGQNYFLMQSFATALDYHLRALHLLQQDPANGVEPSWLFSVELHCAEDYRSLGAYTLARDLYERARLHLRTEHDLKTAAHMYLWLGYCVYGILYQSYGQSSRYDRMLMEELEGLFHRARSFLIQSMSISQACCDQQGEADARLVLALTELDFSTMRKQLAQRRVNTTGKEYPAYQSSFLKDAEEQCRQILLSSQDALRTSDVSPTALDTINYVALAYIIRIYIQRAAIERLSGNYNTALRDRVLAADLCQMVLDSLQEETFPGNLLRQAITLQEEPMTDRHPTLPHIPKSTSTAPLSQSSAISQAEVYFAAGEVTEELGDAATSPEYVQECYSRADLFVHASLQCSRAVVSLKARDIGYLVRSYQRWFNILQERETLTKDIDKGYARKDKMRETCFESLLQLQQAFILSLMREAE